MNSVTLMGRMTKDPELRYTQQKNTAVCTFTIAVDKEMAEGADFINCQAWGKTAEFVSKYFAKGKLIALKGRISTRSWDDKDGKKHFATEVIADRVYFTGDKTQPINQPQQNDGFYPLDDDSDTLPF